MAPPSRRSLERASLDVRRARGELCCAECRRLQQKCDRAIPCRSCIRRGCQSLCPNGTRDTGQKSRLDNSEAKDYLFQLSKMSERIHALENALQTSHSSKSSSPHPLLAGRLLEVKRGVIQSAKIKNKSETEFEGLLGSFGSLTFSEKGTESYVAGPETMLARRFTSRRASAPLAPIAPMASTPNRTDQVFPFVPLYLQPLELQACIESMLPSYERASALVEVYMQSFSLYVRPVGREQIIEELIPEVYRRGISSPTSINSFSGHGAAALDPHALALLLALFACGAIADLTLPPWNEEADLYYHLARAAIGLKSIFDATNLFTVQAILLFGVYELYSCRKDSHEGMLKIVYLSTHLAASIGLHRDPMTFKLSSKLIQRRRRVFWELYAIDIWNCIGSGRPPTFTPSIVDCEFPEDIDATIGEDGTLIPSPRHVLYRFVKEVLTDIAHTLGSANPMMYSDIIILDQKVRDFVPLKPFSFSAGSGLNMQSSSCDTQSVIDRLHTGMLKETILLMMHRHFFARAMIANPENPMQSTFSHSFMATYRSATMILRIIREQFEHNMLSLVRVWPVWAHALASSMMLGSVASCGSTFSLAPQAYIEFSLAINMLIKAQIQPIVRRALPILMQLHERARQTHENRRLDNSTGQEDAVESRYHDVPSTDQMGTTPATQYTKSKLRSVDNISFEPTSTIERAQALDKAVSRKTLSPISSQMPSNNIEVPIGSEVPGSSDNLSPIDFGLRSLLWMGSSSGHPDTSSRTL